MTPTENFKTTDIRAKEDVNRSQHIYNLKEKRAAVWKEYKIKFEKNFNYRVKKFVDQDKKIKEDINAESIKNRQERVFQAGLIKRLNVM